jgi:hypothetical protein
MNMILLYIFSVSLSRNRSTGIEIVVLYEQGGPIQVI